MDEEKIPFAQRHGLIGEKPIYNDFPEQTRVALAYLLDDLVNRQYICEDQGVTSWIAVLLEFSRTARITNPDFQETSNWSHRDEFARLAEQTTWARLFTFCERVYEKLLDGHGYYTDDGNWVEVASLSDAREYYARELNTIVAEDNIGYHFVDGEFQRRGRAQTQHNVQRVGVVLGDERFQEVRKHFNKARKHFDEFPAPDSENCVKEALLALEACLAILKGKPASRDFSKVVKEIQGNGHCEIPPPIAQGMIKLHGYRGSGRGVSHAALDGNKVTDLEAELALSLAAAYITYLVDLLPSSEDDIPF